MKLLYYACDANCHDPGNWNWIMLANLRGTSRFSLRVDSQGRPRLAFYSGQYPDPAFQQTVSTICGATVPAPMAPIMIGSSTIWVSPLMTA